MPFKCVYYPVNSTSSAFTYCQSCCTSESYPTNKIDACCKSGWQTWHIVVLAVVGGLLIMALIAAIIYTIVYKKKRFSIRNAAYNNGALFYPSHVNSNMRL
ncbi:unnamed protein product [Brachionus calyciflorus]|uniref:Uncharacterized protein n=1 Tax=Brachionus calyciflorus TaxID=104777 RepID=A0A814BH78_9BILA|nr:unnamed protein product [Brachionus calyciflorus]